EGADSASRNIFIGRLQAWAKLPRDHFVRIIAEPNDERRCHYVAEDLDGDLQQLVLKDSIEHEGILPLLCRIPNLAATLHAQHRLVHGGLEPRAVLVGGQGRVKLAVLDPLLGADVDVEPASGDVPAASPYQAPERSEIDLAINRTPYHLDVFS